MLYTICFDSSRYMLMLWDAKHVRTLSDGHIDHRIDINGAPARHADIFNEPVRVSFEEKFNHDKGLLKPDLCVFQGRLYLNLKAYAVLYDLLQEDGEFLQVVDEQLNDGYVFTPLRIAEENDALDKKLSRKNEWGDVENLAFHEERVKDWAVFRAEYNIFMSLQCQYNVKEAIEKANLCGVFFTTELGNTYSNQRDGVRNLN